MKPRTAVILLAVILIFSGSFLFYLYKITKPAHVIKTDHPTDVKVEPSPYISDQEKREKVAEFLEAKKKEAAIPTPSPEELEEKREIITNALEEKKQEESLQGQNSNIDHESGIEEKRARILELLKR
jgi:hypothetical protein